MSCSKWNCKAAPKSPKPEEKRTAMFEFTNGVSYFDGPDWAEYRAKWFDTIRFESLFESESEEETTLLSLVYIDRCIKSLCRMEPEKLKYHCRWWETGWRGMDMMYAFVKLMELDRTVAYEIKLDVFAWPAIDPHTQIRGSLYRGVESPESRLMSLRCPLLYIPASICNAELLGKYRSLYPIVPLRSELSDKLDALLLIFDKSSLSKP